MYELTNWALNDPTCSAAVTIPSLSAVLVLNGVTRGPPLSGLCHCAPSPTLTKSVPSGANINVSGPCDELVIGIPSVTWGGVGLVCQWPISIVQLPRSTVGEDAGLLHVYRVNRPIVSLI